MCSSGHIQLKEPTYSFLENKITTFYLLEFRDFEAKNPELIESIDFYRFLPSWKSTSTKTVSTREGGRSSRGNICK